MHCLFKLTCCTILLYAAWCVSRCIWRGGVMDDATEQNKHGLKQQSEKRDILLFHRPHVVAAASLDCRKVLAGDTNYIATLVRQPRIIYRDEVDIPMDCESIRARHHFPQQPLSAGEAAWPWAKARVVYRDYAMLEMELAATYAPQNWYCYAVDANTDSVFRWRVRKLAACFPNVVVAPEEVGAYPSGKGIFPSWLNCLRQLARADRKWEYVSLLQNHDIQLKTNAEMVHIFRWFGGANDVDVGPEQKDRYDGKLDWSFRALNLFQDQARNNRTSPNGFEPILLFSNGLSQSSLTRAMVEFMLNDLNLTMLVDRQETKDRGTDETLVSTLNAADALQTPGGFTRFCATKREVTAPTMSRRSVYRWEVERNESRLECGTGVWLHGSCVMGMENLNWLATRVVELYANKLRPEVDYGALVCWHELLFNWTHHETSLTAGGGRLKETFYRALPQVRFQEFKRHHGTSIKELEKFKCTL